MQAFAWIVSLTCTLLRTSGGVLANTPGIAAAALEVNKEVVVAQAPDDVVT